MYILDTVAPYRSLFIVDQASFTAWGVLVLVVYFMLSAIILWLAVNKITRSLHRIMENFSTSSIAEDPLLGEPWQNYSSTFLLENGRPRKTCEDAENYFNAHSLVRTLLNLRYWHAVPATLAGMGILGTFIGLTFGISAFDIDSAERIRRSIATLLAGMSTAFVTSLWGMLLSILFGWFEKWQLNGIDVEIHRLCSAMNREFKMTRVDELRLARDYERDMLEQLFVFDAKDDGKRTPGQILAELHLEMVHQKSALESLSRELSGANVSPASDLKVLYEYASDSSRLLASSSGQLQEIINRLKSEACDAGVGGSAAARTPQYHFAELAGELRQFLAQQAEVMTEMTTKTGENVVAMLRETSEKSAVQIQTLEKSFHGNLVEILNRQEQNSLVLENLISESKNFVDQSKELTQGVNVTVNNLNNVLKLMANLSAQMMKSTDLLRASSEGLRTTISHFERHSDRMLNLNQTTIANLEILLRKAQEVASDYVSQFELIQTGLNGIFSQMHEGLLDYQRNTRASLNEYLGQFADQLARAVRALSGGIEELNEVFEEFADSKSKLNQQVMDAN